MARISPATLLGVPDDLPRSYPSRSRLFLYASLFSIAGIYLWVLSLSPGYTGIIWTPPLLFLFTSLMLVHAALHWISQYIAQRRIWGLAYLVFQAGIVFTMSYTSHYPAFLLTLYAPLLGEAAGVFESLPLTLLLTGLVYGAYGLELQQTYANAPGFENTVISTLALSFLGSLPYLAALSLQVHFRREAMELVQALDTAHRQLVTYAEQVEQLTLSAERARMARELHDTLAQGVAGVILQLEALETHLERGDNSRAQQVTSQIKSRARDVLGSSRQAIDDLRLFPAQSDTLVEAIRKEVAQFSTLSGIPCSLDIPASLVLHTSTTEHMLRCVTEGLANVARHAHASHVAVSIGILNHAILIQVRDDGVGFDPGAIAHQSGHYGLLGMRERARLAGGLCEVESAVGAGTTLRVNLPISSNAIVQP